MYFAPVRKTSILLILTQNFMGVTFRSQFYSLHASLSLYTERKLMEKNETLWRLTLDGDLKAPKFHPRTGGQTNQLLRRRRK